MSIGTDFARRVVMEEYQNLDPFWNSRKSNGGNFVELNSVVIPSTSAIQAFQLKKIENFQKAAMKKFEGLDAITTSNFQTLFSNFETKEDAEIDKALESLYSGFNSLYWYKNQKGEFSEKIWQNLQQKINIIIARLQTILTKLEGTTPVLEQELKTLQNAANAAGLDLRNPTTVQNFLNSINQFKGDMLEELGVLWLRKLGVPNIQSIRLGSVYLNSASKDKSKSGYIIQDFIAYNTNSPNILDGTKVHYRKTGEDTDTEVTLSELFAIIEDANAKNEIIHINDKTYEVLTNLQSLNIQAKSGKNQKPWNANKRTSVSIAEFSDETDGLSLGINHTFNLLKSLNNLEISKEPWMLKDVTDDYQALANYGLATVMDKVLHLSEKENQYLLTPFGFMSYPARVAQLFKTEQHIAVLKESVSLANALSKKYKVDIS